MIGISKLYCGTTEPSDALRYGRSSKTLPSHLLQFSADKKPVVVWNVTRRCNLRCVHCYSASRDMRYDGELSTAEGNDFIDGCADFGVPVLLFSGGEPLMRPDLFDLVARARSRGMRAVISTNGTLITPEVATKLRDAGLSYVGVSIDGLAAMHDRFRGNKGAYDAALQGIRSCMRVGVKVGLRFTITRDNAMEVPGMFRLIEQEGIPRICFYHLVYTGRGAELAAHDLDHAGTRALVHGIIDRTADLLRRQPGVEVLTVDNHADGVYLYLRMKREHSPRAASALELLRMNGGNNSGISIGCVSWNGDVHPDQFWRHYTCGNVREKPFGDIWSDGTEPLLRNLRNRTGLLKGRCGRCVWHGVCNGNFRVRAEAVHDDPWQEDPACYLTEEEISGTNNAAL
ncbi:MAG: radical SAM protein [Chitinispirillaceae bacterium]|nr:radical SAM protein [Chitinispirillaceae bacterium]